MVQTARNYTLTIFLIYMRRGLVVLSILVGLLLISLPVQAQDLVEEEGNVIIDVVLPLALAFIMFSLGLGLTRADFFLVFNEPKAFAIGFFNQMIALPIIGFSVAILSGLDGELAVGLMILACCPGGVTSNILTKLAKGDTALSISYTAVISVIAVFTLPLIVGFSMSYFMGEVAPDIDILGLGITMFLLTTLPVLIGMMIRHRVTDMAKLMERGVNTIATILFVIIVIAAIASEWNTLVENIGTLGPSVIVLNVLMLGIGYQSAKLFNIDTAKATTVSIESGIQNATVGITIGGLILASPDGGLSTLSLPSGVYGVLMYPIISPFIYWRLSKTKISKNDSEE